MLNKKMTSAEPRHFDCLPYNTTTENRTTALPSEAEVADVLGKGAQGKRMWRWMGAQMYPRTLTFLGAGNRGCSGSGLRLTGPSASALPTLLF